MKRLFQVLTALFLLTSLSFSQGFNSVFSKDGIAVIAVGDAGNVFMSYDAGTTFGSYPIGGGLNFNSVYAINQKVWIVGDAGAVQVSLNGGNSYTSYGIGGNDLNSVYFTDETTGWAVGNGGRIVKTVNGGVSWTPQTSPSSDNLTGVKFTSASNGYACGDNGKVIYTVNGGTTWLSYTTSFTKNLLSIDVSGSTIIATAVDGLILKYDGSLWSAIDYKIVTKSDVRSVSMVNSSAFYTCGGGGFINISTDAGVTRTYQANPMMAPLSDIYFYDGNKGWAVASTNNAILRTANGGASWQFQNGVTVNYSYTIKQATTGNIGNPFCLHPMNKNGMFILAGSALYRSLNRGETWTLLNSSVPGSSCHSFYVNALDTNLMIAAKGSSGGRLIRSTNYGTTWTDIFNPINLTSYGMPLEVDPNNPNTIYLAPDNLPLRKSTDWGANWTTLTGPESGVFRSPCDVIVQFENPNTIIVGDGTTGSGSGKVWKSIDGGTNWTLINTVSGSEIPMIANTSLDLSIVYHTTWSSGSYWKSTNMGSGFTNLNQSGSLWASDVAKDDPTAIAYDQYGSNSFLSLNGGATFTPAINVGSSPAAGVLFYDKSILLFQHGSGVYKLNITYNVTPVTGNHQITSEIPAVFGLAQNYPNPFNPTTVIKYDVAKASYVSIRVFDVLGNEAATVISGNMTPGRYSADFNASNLATGIYFYSLVVDGVKIDTKKMILVK